MTVVRLASSVGFAAMPAVHGSRSGPSPFSPAEGGGHRDRGLPHPAVCWILAGWQARIRESAIAIVVWRPYSEFTCRSAVPDAAREGERIAHGVELTMMGPSCCVLTVPHAGQRDPHPTRVTTTRVTSSQVAHCSSDGLRTAEAAIRPPAVTAARGEQPAAAR